MLREAAPGSPHPPLRLLLWRERLRGSPKMTHYSRPRVPEIYPSLDLPFLQGREGSQSGSV